MKKIFSFLAITFMALIMVACSNNKTEATKYNNAPTLVASDRTIEYGSRFNYFEGVSASTSLGEDLTSEITYQGQVNPTKVGTYSVTYTVSDSEGHETSKTVTITVIRVDREGPIISGVKPLELTVGTKFNKMDGVTAIDTIDGDVSDTISCEGSIDIYQPGTYTFTYYANDTKGNESTITRTVTVSTGAFRFNEENKALGNIFEGYLNVAEYGYGMLAVEVEANGEVELSCPGFRTSKVQVEGTKVIYLVLDKPQAGVDDDGTIELQTSVTTNNGTIVSITPGVPGDITPPTFSVDATIYTGTTVYLPTKLNNVPISASEAMAYIKSVTGVTAFDKKDNEYKLVTIKSMDLSKVGEVQKVTLSATDDADNEAMYDIPVVFNDMICVNNLNPGAMENKNTTAKDQTVAPAQSVLRYSQDVRWDVADEWNFTLVNDTVGQYYYENKIQILLGKDIKPFNYYMISFSIKSKSANRNSFFRTYLAANDGNNFHFAGNADNIVIAANPDGWTNYNLYFHFNFDDTQLATYGAIIEWDFGAYNYVSFDINNTLDIKGFAIYALSQKADEIENPYNGETPDVEPTLFKIQDFNITDTGLVTFTENKLAQKYLLEVSKGGQAIGEFEITNNYNVNTILTEEGIYSFKVRYQYKDKFSDYSAIQYYTKENGAALNSVSGQAMLDVLNLDGRTTLDENKNVSFYYTASGFKVAFTGTKLSATFKTVDNTQGKPYIIVLVDGELYPDHGTTICLDKAGVASYSLALGLENGPHTVEVLKRTEASNNTIILSSIATDGTFNAKPADKSLNILMLGASGSTGYANLNSSEQKTYNSDGMKAFPYLVKQMYDAEITEINASGWGVVNGWNAQNGQANIPTAWKRNPILPGNGLPKEAYDISQENFDIVMINLGMNDFNAYINGQSLTGAAREAAINTFKNGIKQLYLDLHEAYPNAILLVIATSFTNQNAEGYYNKMMIAEAMKELPAGTEDFIFTVEIPANGANGAAWGGNGHANVQTHIWSADKISEELEKHGFHKVRNNIEFVKARDFLG